MAINLKVPESKELRPRITVLGLRGDVCRRELDVELEGVFAAK